MKTVATVTVRPTTDDAGLQLDALIREGRLAPYDRRELEAHLSDSSDATAVVVVAQHLGILRPPAASRARC
jgi:hypothetical protein